MVTDKGLQKEQHKSCQVTTAGMKKETEKMQDYKHQKNLVEILIFSKGHK